MTSKYNRYNDLDALRNALRKAEQHATWMLQGYLNAEGAEEALQDFMTAVDTAAKAYAENAENAAEGLAEALEEQSEKSAEKSAEKPKGTKAAKK